MKEIITLNEENLKNLMDRIESSPGLQETISRLPRIDFDRLQKHYPFSKEFVGYIGHEDIKDANI